MSTVNFTQFLSASNATPDTDYIVGYNVVNGTAQEAKWTVRNLANKVLPTANVITAGKYAIKFLAEKANDYYAQAAVTYNNEVIAWGGNNGYYKWGSNYASSYTDSNLPIQIPFFQGNPNSPSELVYDLNAAGVNIVSLSWNYMGAVALLDDGTLWVKSYIDSSNSYPHGFATGQVTGATARYLSGFYKITNWTFTSGQTKKIVKFEVAPAYTGGNYSAYLAIDEDGDLHVWGRIDPKWGASYDYFVPQNITNGTTLQGKIRDAQWSGVDGNRTLSVISTDNGLYHSGYNGYGQLGQGNTTALTSLTQAKYWNGANAVLVTNASKFLRSSWNYFNLAYISTVTSNQNAIYTSGWENNTYSIRIEGTAPDNYYYISGVTSQTNEPFVDGIITGRSTNPTALAITSTGRVYSAGASNWGEGGRLNGANYYLGPTWVQCSYANPSGGLSVFGTSTNDKAISITTDFSSANANCVCVLAQDQTTQQVRAYLTGYFTFVNSGLGFPASDATFRPLPVNESIAQVVMGGNWGDHAYSFFRTVNGRVYGLGYSVYGLLQSSNEYVPLPRSII